MYGPAFLVAPVTEQGATQRAVYLPAGCDWYNYWTNERFHGGQTITADAPIDTLPLFVRAGSIVPLGLGGAERGSAADDRVRPGVSQEPMAASRFFRTTERPTTMKRAAAQSRS